MGERLRAALVVSAALVAMAFAVSSANAVEMSISPAGAISASSSNITFSGEGLGIICAVTLSGIVARGPIPVRAEAQYGEITGVRWEGCSGGTIERPLGLPWRILISSTLPAVERLTTRNLTGILSALVGTAINLSSFGGFVNCLYAGTTGGLASFTHTGRESTSYTVAAIGSLSEIRVQFISGSGLCPRTGSFAGTFTFSTQTVTLS